jgi:DNA-binding response OmpR family regulator
MKTPSAHAPPVTYSNSGPKILVIEDETETRRLLALVFRGQGFEVETVSTGEEGLRAANKRNFVLILSDIDLPGIDGFEVCRWVKQNPKLHSVPVILMSGRLQEATEPLAFQHGAADYLSKPFRIATLLSKVFACVSTPNPPRYDPRRD